jgi:hypothetical protein
MRIFLSYARPDEERVREIHTLLANAGWLPWMDTQNIVGGMDWERQIQEQIRQADLFFLFASPQSVARRGILQREIRTALHQAQEFLPADIFIVPLLLEDCEIPDEISRYQWVDIRQPDWQEQLIRTVLTAQAQRGREQFRLEQNSENPLIIEDVVEQTERGEIRYQIPRLILLQDANRTRELNELLAGAIRRQVHQYRARFEDWPAPEHAVGSYMDLSIAVSLSTTNFFSASIPIHYYFAGAAHPSMNFETITAFLPTPRSIELDSLFDYQTGYIEFLKERIIEQIVQHFLEEIEENYVRDQINSDWVSLETFTLNRNGITFYFDSLLAHAYGPQVIDIPANGLLPYMRNSNITQSLRNVWNT